MLSAGHGRPRAGGAAGFQGCNLKATTSADVPLVICAQGMDDQALEVLRAAKATEVVLASKAQSLAAMRTEYERKQKEVALPSCPESNTPMHARCSD